MGDSGTQGQTVEQLGHRLGGCCQRPSLLGKEGLLELRAPAPSQSQAEGALASQLSHGPHLLCVTQEPFDDAGRTTARVEGRQGRGPTHGRAAARWAAHPGTT